MMKFRPLLLASPQRFIKPQCRFQHFALTVALFCLAPALMAANMTPISVSGYNWDVVIENTAVGPPFTAYASELNPGEGNAFYQSGLPGYSYGMPDTGSFVSAVGDGTVF